MHIWNCYTSPIRKLKIYTNSKFLYRYEITALMLKILKQILTNVEEAKIKFQYVRTIWL